VDIKIKIPFGEMNVSKIKLIIRQKTCVENGQGTTVAIPS
jgi:hypothetical protein